MKKVLYNFYQVLVRLSWLWKPKPGNKGISNYSICIVTYYKRFDKNLKPLIKQLISLYPGCEIIVGVNGYHNQTIQNKFLTRFKKFISNYNITWFSYDTGQSISKMWNQCIQRSSNQWMLVLNDDILLAKSFRKAIDSIELNKNTIYVLNTSWSHFLISKEVISIVGWFDERFPGVGNEDWDYEIRAILGKTKIDMVKTRAIINLIVETKDFSYSPIEKVVNLKYSNSNWEFFKEKWSIQNNFKTGYLQTRFPQIPYVKLKPGMETPNFYIK